MVAQITTGNSLPLVALLSGPLRQAGLHVPLAFSPRELPSVGDDTPCYELPLPLNTNEVSFTFNSSFIIFQRPRSPLLPLSVSGIYLCYTYLVFIFWELLPNIFAPLLFPIDCLQRATPPQATTYFIFSCLFYLLPFCSWPDLAWRPF